MPQDPIQKTLQSNKEAAEEKERKANLRAIAGDKKLKALFKPTKLFGVIPSGGQESTLSPQETAVATQIGQALYGKDFDLSNMLVSDKQWSEIAKDAKWREQNRPTPDPSKQKTAEQATQKSIATAMQNEFKPLEEQQKELTQEYQGVMGGVQQMENPNATGPGTVAGADAALEAGIKAGGSYDPTQTSSNLSQAEANASASAMTGSQDIGNALGAQEKATQAYAQALPNSDILNTLLVQQKNELLYGNPPGGSVTPNKAGYPAYIQAIMGYIQNGNQVPASASSTPTASTNIPSQNPSIPSGGTSSPTA